MSLQNENSTKLTETLPRSTITESFFIANISLTKFAKDKMKPLLDGMINLNEKENAIVATYFRMYAWMRTLIALNENTHFQGVAAATRSLFELMLDMELIHSDKDGKWIIKYHSFPNVEKLKTANQVVAFYDSKEIPLESYLIPQKRYLELVDRNNIDKVLADNWNLNIEKLIKRGEPRHWTGLSVKRRAKELDSINGGFKNEIFYLEVYPILSWYIHSGSTGTLGLDDRNIENIFRWSHYLAQQAFINATKICAKEFKIDRAIDNFYNILDDTSLVGARYIQDQIDKQIKSQK